MKPIFKLLIAVGALLCTSVPISYALPPVRYCYMFKIYHLKTDEQEKRMDTYLKSAYLPAMHRAGIKGIGVFKPIDADTSGKLIYVFLAAKSQTVLENAEQQMSTDGTYLKEADDYLKAPYNQPAYNRIERIVLSAFEKMPQPQAPNLSTPKSERYYELRSYESPTEAYLASKVKMFNDGGETEIFKRLNFNAVFYARVLYGSQTPNLMYLTTFNSKDDRDNHWKLFSADPAWKSLSGSAEYQHNVSKSNKYFIRPTDYSDF